jgi:thiosulfate/3-mercaptopyruvate sulfurtransferase
MAHTAMRKHFMLHIIQGRTVFRDNNDMRFLMPLALSVAAFAQDPLITVDSLAAQLKDPALVILHVGSRQDYDAGHIPGARLVTLGDISVTGQRNLRLEMPPMETLEAALLKLGIGNTSKVVIYAATDSVQSATRVWFTFDYVGLKASLLDGGLAAWKAKSLEVTTQPSAFEPATALKLTPHPEYIVDAEWLNAHRQDQGVVMLDARLPEFYKGTSAGQMPRAGHIPGAWNLPFPNLLTATKEFIPKKQLSEHLGNGSTIVTYCHIGQQATVLYFAGRVSGKNVKLYDGSFQDWSARPELPVATK